MAVSLYRLTPARIDISSGLRLPADFYRDHPQFAGAAGQVEVLDDSTLLLRLEPEEQQLGEAEEDTLMLGLFLGLALPDRYRLFSRPFEAEGRRLLLILWLGFPR
jgi:antitoxin PrlF